MIRVIQRFGGKLPLRIFKADLDNAYRNVVEDGSDTDGSLNWTF